MSNINKNYGGTRQGAGRPKSAPTKPIFIRVPVADYDALLARCREVIKSFYNNKNE